jgi:hypothetical protein
MHKYVTITIVVDALISMNKLFNQYIFIPHGPHLFRIMGEFFIHVAYLTFVMPLRGHIFYFPKSQINGLLQYLQIIIANMKVVIQLFCKQFVTWTSCFGMYVV